MHLSSLTAALGMTSTVLGLAGAATAQTVQATLFQSGFTSPVGIESAPGDPARLFIVEQAGRIKIVSGGSTLATPFLHLGSVASGGSGKISTGGERGLLGLAFHPDYANNGYFYVDYTAVSTGATVIARYQVSANPNVANSASELVLLTIPQPQSNHNGGCLRFGADGKLYIGMGDGGNGNDTGTGHNPTLGNAQDPATLLGKMLRLDVDLPAPYVPVDNPYVGPGAPLDEIWHMGLRNPWRFSFDRSTGDLYIGDVGQNAVEEIDFAAAGVGGLNFGWRCMEGLNCTGLSGCTCNAPSLTLPIKVYPNAPGASAIGGFVYRGANICGLQGTYFYADYSSTVIWSFRYAGGVVTNFTDRTAQLEPAGAPTIGAISSFGEDATGELYIADYGDGEIYRVDPAGGLVDCNANGVNDLCDIQNGTALDCNANNVPDACDIASGTAQDCNANGVPDACDIGAGTSLDVNANSIPDECECAGGAPPFVYCTAKLNSQFCLPEISSVGYPSLSNPAPFVIGAVNLINAKSAVLFYGSQSSATIFQGSFLCVRAPLIRCPVLNTGGSATGIDCSGTLAFDFRAYMALGTDPSLMVVGQQVNAQFWSRDPADSFTTNTTDAVQFQICQ